MYGSFCFYFDRHACHSLVRIEHWLIKADVRCASGVNIESDALYGNAEVLILAMRRTKLPWFITGMVDIFGLTSHALFCLVFLSDVGFGGRVPLTSLPQHTSAEWPRLYQFSQRWFEYLWWGLFRPFCGPPVLSDAPYRAERFWMRKRFLALDDPLFLLKKSTLHNAKRENPFLVDESIRSND